MKQDDSYDPAHEADMRAYQREQLRQEFEGYTDEDFEAEAEYYEQQRAKYARNAAMRRR